MTQRWRGGPWSTVTKVFPLQKFKVCPSAGKVMLTVFRCEWRCPHRVSSQGYRELIALHRNPKEAKGSTDTIRPDNGAPLLLHDNARPHTNKLTTNAVWSLDTLSSHTPLILHLVTFASFLRATTTHQMRTSSVLCDRGVAPKARISTMTPWKDWCAVGGSAWKGMVTMWRSDVPELKPRYQGIHWFLFH